MLLMLLYYLALFFEWHCHMSWVTIKISLPVIYIMAKMEYALTLADSHASSRRANGLLALLGWSVGPLSE